MKDVFPVNGSLEYLWESLGQHNYVKIFQGSRKCFSAEAMCWELWQSLKNRATCLVMFICALENGTLPTKTMIVNRPGTFHVKCSLEIANRLETWWQMPEKVIACILPVCVCIPPFLSSFLLPSSLSTFLSFFVFFFYFSLMHLLSTQFSSEQ